MQQTKSAFIIEDMTDILDTVNTHATRWAFATAWTEALRSVFAPTHNDLNDFNHFNDAHYAEMQMHSVHEILSLAAEHSLCDETAVCFAVLFLHRLHRKYTAHNQTVNQSTEMHDTIVVSDRCSAIDFCAALCIAQKFVSDEPFNAATFAILARVSADVLCRAELRVLNGLSFRTFVSAKHTDAMLSAMHRAKVTLMDQYRYMQNNTTQDSNE